MISADFSEEINWIVDEISEDIDIYFSGGSDPVNINVMSDSIQDWDNLQPSSIPGSQPAFGQTVENAQFSEEFTIDDGKILWHSLDSRDLAIEVNTSEYFKASATTVFGERIFNGFTNEAAEPAQVTFMDIEDTGHVAVAWAVDIWS